MNFISTKIQKLNKEYKPLGVAVFLAVGGLLSGFLWNSVFVSNPGTVQERRISEASALLPQAEGAEIDSAALIPQGSPFVASADSAPGDIQIAQNTDMLYGEGAVRDSEPVMKTKTVPTDTTSNVLASGVMYKIESGDTLSSISATFGVPLDMIVEFNPSVNFSSLIPGTSIVIPSQKDITFSAG